MVPHVAQLGGVAGVAAPPGAKQLLAAPGALLGALGQQHVPSVAVEGGHQEHAAAAVGQPKACRRAGAAAAEGSAVLAGQGVWPRLR